MTDLFKHALKKMYKYNFCWNYQAKGQHFLRLTHILHIPTQIYMRKPLKWGTVPQADCTDIGKALLYTGIWWHCVSCSHSRTERLKTSSSGHRWHLNDKSTETDMKLNIHFDVPNKAVFADEHYTCSMQLINKKNSVRFWWKGRKWKYFSSIRQLLYSIHSNTRYHSVYYKHAAVLSSVAFNARAL